MNLVLGIVSLLVTFSLVVIIEKFFKKEGLYVWIAIATIISNIMVCKSVDIIGLTTNLGNVLFASSFLATDVLSEKYSVKDSKKAVVLGVVSQVIFILLTQIALLYKPSEIDMAQKSMKGLFEINLRVSIASITMYFVSNMFDIYLFEKLKQKFPNKLWLRNNISTIISNCLENYLFTTLAFVGLFSLKTIFSIASFASVLEMIIAACDTPFLYLMKRTK